MKKKGSFIYSQIVRPWAKDFQSFSAYHFNVPLIEGEKKHYEDTSNIILKKTKKNKQNKTKNLPLTRIKKCVSLKY